MEDTKQLKIAIQELESAIVSAHQRSDGVDVDDLYRDLLELQRELDRRINS